MCGLLKTIIIRMPHTDGPLLLAGQVRVGAGMDLCSAVLAAVLPCWQAGPSRCVRRRGHRREAWLELMHSSAMHFPASTDADFVTEHTAAHPGHGDVLLPVDHDARLTRQALTRRTAS